MRRLLLATVLLVSLFFIFSCEKNQNFALDLLPQEDLVNVKLVDTFTVNLTTEPFTHIQSNGKGKVFFGSYYDPIFGYTKASFVTQLQQFGYPKFNDSCTVDSVILIMKIDPEFTPYGKPFNPVPVYVYEVKDTLKPYYKYYADDPFDKYASDNLLGQGTFSLYEGGNDTVMKVYLDPAFGQRLADSVDYYFYSEDAKFTDRFFGLAITPGPGFYDAAIYRFTFKVDFERRNFQSFLHSMVKIYYHPDTLPDTAMVYILSMTQVANAHFTMFEHDYSGTSVLDPAIDSVAFLQTAGTRIKLDFPYLYKLKDQVVYKAELVLPLASPSITFETSYPAPETVYLLGFDSNDTTQTPILIQDYFNRRTGEYYGAPLFINKYKINVTRIVQALINQDTTSDFPTSYYLMDYNSSLQLSRAVINSGKNSIPAKLVITLSKY